MVQDGSMRDGEWFCRCEMSPIKLTSKTATNPGRRFRKCQKSQCRFFLWEDDEPTARERYASQHVPAPLSPSPSPTAIVYQSPQQTPATPPRQRSSGNNVFQAIYPQTPETRHTNSPPSSGRSLDASPTPSRPVGKSGGAAESIMADVLKLLRSSKVYVDPALEARLRHKLHSDIGVYESKLQTSEETIDELCKQLYGLGC